MISVENLDKFSDDESITTDRPYGNKNVTTSRSPLSPIESPKDYFSRSTPNERPNNVSFINKLGDAINLTFSVVPFLCDSLAITIVPKWKK